MGFGTRDNKKANGLRSNETVVTLEYRGYCSTCESVVYHTANIVIPTGSHGTGSCTMTCTCGGSIPGIAHF